MGFDRWCNSGCGVDGTVDTRNVRGRFPRAAVFGGRGESVLDRVMVPHARQRRFAALQWPVEQRAG